MYNMYILCVAALSVTLGVAQGAFLNLPPIPDGITLNNVLKTWEKANLHCQSEGAVLASPINENMFNLMKSWVNATKSTFYIGTKATQQTGLYIALEGIPLANETMTWQELDPRNGDCLAMEGDGVIRVVPCDTWLAYMCIKRDILSHTTTSNPSESETLETKPLESEPLESKPLERKAKTNCGPRSEGYILTATGSCYKHHKPGKTWEEASAKCIEEGAYLAIINNHNEANIVRELIQGRFWSEYLGLRDVHGNGTWESIHGDPIESLYDVWNAYEAGHRPAYDDRRCGSMFPDSGKLTEVRCSDTRYFVCEKDPTN